MNSLILLFVGTVTYTKTCQFYLYKYFLRLEIRKLNYNKSGIWQLTMPDARYTVHDTCARCKVDVYDSKTTYADCRV